jgi:hypothetical protein
MSGERSLAYVPAQSADPTDSPQTLSLRSLRQREEACPAPPTYLETDLDLEVAPEERNLVTHNSGTLLTCFQAYVLYL